MTQADSIPKLFYRVREICLMTGLTKAKVLRAIHAGKLPARKVDGCWLIPAESLEVYLGTAIPRRWDASG